MNIKQLYHTPHFLISFKYSRMFILVIPYLLVCLWLLLGSAMSNVNSSALAVKILLIHMCLVALVSIGCVYIYSLCKSKLRFETQPYQLNLSKYSQKKLSLFFVSLLIFAIATNYHIWGEIPLFTALAADSSLEAAIIRSLIQQHSPVWLKYLNSILLLGILPCICLFVVLMNLPGRRWIMGLSLLFSAFFLQKSYPLFIIIPALTYCWLSKQCIRGIKVMFAGIAFFLFIHLTLSAQFFFIKNYSSDSTSHITAISPTNHVKGISERAFLIPGKTGALWLDAIPQKMPFLNGCGYRFLAPILKCQFVHYPEKIYAFYNPEFYAKGLMGTMNVAEIFNSYANFGITGVVLSGFIISLFLSLLGIIFRHYWQLTLSLFLPQILMMSSSAFSTQLLSGGWMFSIGVLSIFYFFTERPSCVASQA